MLTHIEKVTSLLAIACVYLVYKNKQAFKLIDQLKGQTASLKELNQFKGEALSNISHEIRTPISAILGVQEKILRGKALPAHEEKILASAHASTHSMLDILNQVLDAEKIAKGKLQLEEEPCDVKNLLKHIERTFAETINKSKVTFEASICSEIAGSLSVDGTRLGQILHNLLSNAIKQTAEGQITLVTRVIANDHFGQLIYFEIADTGAGMSLDDIERLRQPYEQNRQPAYQFSELGSGLGLPITEQLLKLMGSSLMIESAPNLGSSFSFSLSLRRSIDQPRYGSLQPTLGDPMDPVPLSQTVLVVDDHTPSRLITESQFKDMGYCVHSVSSAPSAMALMNDHSFDMVVTDFSMPGMSGHELAKLVRQSAQGRYIQIYGITAHTDGAKELLNDKCHFDNILIKPASIKDWQREIHLKRTYIQNLEKITGDDPKIYKIIAEEILMHQISTFNLLLPFLSDTSTSMSSLEISQLAHKLLGGAKLINDESLIKICERMNKNPKLINTNSISDLCIALTKSNNILRNLLDSSKEQTSLG